MLKAFWRVPVMSIMAFRAGSNNLVASRSAVGAAAAETAFRQICRCRLSVAGETSFETLS